MENQFNIDAELRSTHKFGSNESRRLRRAGKVPAIVYGGNKESIPLLVDANKLVHHLQNEAFYSHILTLKVNGNEEQVILRNLQRHPSKSEILHLDLLRVSRDQALKVNVPLHFVGEDDCIGVKQQRGIISHLQTEVEVFCLPKDLPEFIEIDITNLEIGHALHLSDLQLPAGVEIVVLSHGGEENDNAIVSVNMPRVIEEEVVDEEEVAVEAEGDVQTAEETKDESASATDKDKD